MVICMYNSKEVHVVTVIGSDQIFQIEKREKIFQPIATKNTYYDKYRRLLHYVWFDIYAYVNIYIGVGLTM